MSANLRYYVGTMFELDHVLRRVPTDAWERPSPCEGWTTRETAGHAIAVVASLAAKLGRGPAVDPFGDVGAMAGDDPAATFRPIRSHAFEVLDTEHVLAAAVESSMGTFTIDTYLVPLGRDAVVHAWDIARGAGIDPDLDPALVDATLERLDPTALVRGPGRYGDEVAVDDGAPPLDRLLALTGRDPGWSPMRG